MNQIKKELDNIPIPDELMDFMYKGIQQAKREENISEMNRPVISKRKKIIGAFAGLVAVGGLFFGAAFVSPVMAEMAGKIPFLRDVFIKDLQTGDVKPVFSVLRETAMEKYGYTVESMAIGGYLNDVPDALTVLLKDVDYNETSKLEVEKLLKEILDKKGYFSKSIEVIPFKEDLYKSMIRINILMNQQAKEIEQEIKNKGYEVDFVGMNREMAEVFVLLPDSEKRVEEVRNIIQNYQKTHDNEFPLDIRTELDHDTLLKRNLFTIFDGLVSKKEYKVEYFKYTKGNPLVITIKASIDKYNKGQLEIADNIRNEIKTVLDKEYKQPYKINIYGINDEEID